MRTPLVAALLGSALVGGPVLAQGIANIDPNSWNATMARQGEVRALQQNWTSDLNTLRMQNQRAAQFQPGYAPSGAFPLRRSGVGPIGAHRSATPGGRARAARGFDPGICIGC